MVRVVSWLSGHQECSPSDPDPPGEPKEEAHFFHSSVFEDDDSESGPGGKSLSSINSLKRKL